MGPSFFNDGNPKLDIPSSGDKSANTILADVNNDASMGPSFFNDGNIRIDPSFNAVSAVAAIPLQWGRRFSTTETVRTSLRSKAG